MGWWYILSLVVYGNNFFVVLRILLKTSFNTIAPAFDEGEQITSDFKSVIKFTWHPKSNTASNMAAKIITNWSKFKNKVLIIFFINNPLNWLCRFVQHALFSLSLCFRKLNQNNQYGFQYKCHFYTNYTHLNMHDSLIVVTA